MKCFECYSIEQIKEMSHEELKVLYQKFVDEKNEEILRNELVRQYEINTGCEGIIEN